MRLILISFCFRSLSDLGPPRLLGERVVDYGVCFQGLEDIGNGVRTLMRDSGH